MQIGHRLRLFRQELHDNIRITLHILQIDALEDR